MTRIEQEVQNNPSINWKKIKEVLCGIQAQLEIICEDLPIGLLKAVICGIAKTLSVICSKL